MINKDIIRNKQKIMATIHNAEKFQRIAEKHGSFQEWLDSMNKSNNYQYVVKRLVSRFKRVGPATVHIFLWSVGEPIKYDETLHNRRPVNLPNDDLYYRNISLLWAKPRYLYS
ncbi:MAG: DNA-3-methyladenine glycosylase I [archaeon]|jgi:3-methyladenine DNA glycosylase Tag